MCPECITLTSCKSAGLKEKLEQADLVGDGRLHSLLADLGTPTGFPQILTPIVDTASKVELPLETPTEQIGNKYWQTHDDSVDKINQEEHMYAFPSSFLGETPPPFSATEPLFAEDLSNFTSLPSPSTMSNTDSFNDAQMVKVLLAPEKSSFDPNEVGAIVDGKRKMSCVFNVKTAEYEPPPLSLSKELQLITDINKTKITNTVWGILESRLSASDFQEVDITNIGKLVLLDYMEKVRFNGEDFYKEPLVILFESALVVLNNTASEVILMQAIDVDDRISSVYADEANESIIINFTILQLPEICFDTGSKIILQKWTKILKILMATANSRDNDSSEMATFWQPQKASAVSNHIPLIQVSTNAWNILADYDEDSIPESVRKFNRLITKGLDLPFDYLNRQISKPEGAPVNLILTIPLYNSEDSEFSDSQYVDKVKSIIRSAFNLLGNEDKIGLVFLSKNASDLLLGHYYGMATKSWHGWKDVLSSITETCISNNDSQQWSEGLHYLEILVNIGFSKADDCINEIIFATSEILSELNSSISRMKRSLQQSSQKGRKVSISVSQAIQQICEDSNAMFCGILLADEFRYSTTEKLVHHNKLVNSNKPGVYCNRIKDFLVLDLDDYKEVLETILCGLDNITVREISTSIHFPPEVKLLEVEFQGELIKVGKDKQSITLRLSNLQSGYDKSFMFTVGIQLDGIDNRVITKGGKISIATAETHILSNSFSNESLLTTNLDVRLAPDEQRLMDAYTPLSLTISNNKDQEMNEVAINVKLPIVSRLSAVSDAFFIKRKMELQVATTIKNVIFQTREFNFSTKEAMKMKIKEVINEIWGLSKSCNESNTANAGNSNFKVWSEQLIDELTDIMEGYSLRNHQLSTHKSFCCYLAIL
ncbi:hypothetical protein FOA43_004722 [Brettanomyces nanus]|uniref:Uncharacterized protein n=1 Tax=Eeniella nana TaxID=13502 RepID=A0A875S8V8_EENNA|nr:uncharacterized protein FOA43_004722 [Brettanomyces nanus]QPG77313.1 hypothetical protein FOA43_004722 [Brettanomyces nanus]